MNIFKFIFIGNIIHFYFGLRNTYQRQSWKYP
jgi:hypothetical protein